MNRQILYSNIPCKCGCGLFPKQNNTYINGHNTKNSKRALKHGDKGTRLYNTYNSMKQRCNNPKDKAYKDYGGRGITICPEWTDSYIAFRDWSLSHGYQEGLEIDREDNDKGYSPENCRWITHKENCNNRRKIKLSLEKANEIRTLYNSGYYTQKELAEKYDVSYQLIWFIINNKRWLS